MPLTTPSSPAWATPERLLRLSVAVAVLTIALKTLAWVLTDSVGLQSDAMESLVNLAGALFALGMVTIARRPADADHPYGHTKAEYFSSGFEGLLILGAAMAIIWTATQRLLNPQPLAQLGLGLTLSVLSSLFNGALAWLLLRAGRTHRSMALEADGRHLLADVWTSAGVVLGLLASAFTGWLWLDPLIALAVGLHIIKEGGSLVWRSSQGLMDEAVPAASREAINQILAALPAAHGAQVHADHVVTRQAAQRSFVELHLHLPGEWTLQRAARLRSQLEADLMAAVPGLVVTIELLPTGATTLSELALHVDEAPPRTMT